MAESDVLAVSRIVSDGYMYHSEREGYTAEQTERLLNERSTVSDIRRWLSQWTCFVAVADAGVVGALAIDRNDIGELWVHAGHRRQGIGSELFDKAERVILDTGFRELTVRCAAASARPFYQGMGCVVAGVRPCPNGPLAGWPLTHYRKELQAQRRIQA